MKIAQIMAGAEQGGAELYFERLNIALAQHGETVLVIIRRNAARAERLRAQSLNPYELKFGGRFDFLTRYRLNKILKEFKPKVVFTWMSRATRHTPRGPWLLVGRLGGYYDLKYYQHCDYLVANTPDLVTWIIGQKWPANKVYYLPNFVNDYKGALPAQLGIAEKTKIIFSLGRLHANKAFDTLVQAMQFIPDAHLFIAGEGPERKNLEILIKNLGLAERIHLLGWRDDNAALLAACDVFVCPSRHEPLGNVIIEAFSAEKPVVATRSQGALSLIKEEYSGLLCPIDEPETLAKQINRLLNDKDLSSQLAKAARHEFELNFSEKPVIKRWQEFLQQLEQS